MTWLGTGALGLTMWAPQPSCTLLPSRQLVGGYSSSTCRCAWRTGIPGSVSLRRTVPLRSAVLILTALLRTTTLQLHCSLQIYTVTHYFRSTATLSLYYTSLSLYWICTVLPYHRYILLWDCTLYHWVCTKLVLYYCICTVCLYSISLNCVTEFCTV